MVSNDKFGQVIGQFIVLVIVVIVFGFVWRALPSEIQMALFIATFAFIVYQIVFHK